MSKGIWGRCINAGCVVLPVKVYSAYIDGNLHDSTYIGIKYAAVQFENAAVGPDYWFMIDESSEGLGRLFDSPMQAVESFERERAPMTTKCELDCPELVADEPKAPLDNIAFLQTWMRTPNPMLGGAVPLEMMKGGLGPRLAAFIEQAHEAEGR